MNHSNYRISMDIHDTESGLALKAKKGDSIRRLYVTLMDGGVPYRITPDCTAAFTAMKPDNTIIFNEALIENNAVVYELTPQTTAAAGQVRCEVRLYGGDGRLITSPRFFLDVDDTVFTEGDEVISGDEYTVLEDAIQAAYDAIDAIEEDWQRRVEGGEFTGPQGPPAQLDTTLTQSGMAADARAAGDAIAARHKTFSLTLPASGWSSAAPYSQTVTVSGILSTDMPHICPVYSDTLATALAQKEAWAMVDRAVTGAGSITFRCFESKPTTAIPLQIEVNR